jgi:hypothetical protein
MLQYISHGRVQGNKKTLAYLYVVIAFFFEFVKVNFLVNYHFEGKWWANFIYMYMSFYQYKPALTNLVLDDICVIRPDL